MWYGAHHLVTATFGQCKGNTPRATMNSPKPFETPRWPSIPFDGLRWPSIPFDGLRWPSIPFDIPRYPSKPLEMPSRHFKPSRSLSAHSHSFTPSSLSTLVVLHLQRTTSNSLNGSSNPLGYPG